MAEDQFQSSGGNWWDSAGRNNNSNMRYESGGASQSSSSGISTNSNFANWHQQDHPHPHHHDHVAAAVRRSSMEDDAGQHGGSSVVFHHHQQHPDPNLHMMGLGLSSPSSLDWDQPPSFLRGEKGGAENSSSLRCMVQQENLGSSRTNNYQQQFSPGDSTVTSQQGSGFHHNIESSALYGSPSSILMQGLLLGPPPPDPTNTNLQHLPFPSMTYGLMTSNASATDLVPPAAPAQQQLFFRGSAPPNNHNHLLHFTNNAPFWNASEAASPTIKHLRSTAFFPSSLQPPFSTSPPNLDSMCEVRESGGAVKKSGSEQTAKRPRNETPSPLPAFKVRKEKMGDRITALQQLVSPFGKTDTASVLSEAIEYIKFLHEQVTVLSTPYMKSGAPIQIQQSSGKFKEGGEGPKQDLRSRGLCLVPVSSTFPVTHETTVDFWTPTFGGGSR